MELGLVDLLESYPSAYNAKIQQKVTDKHEFAELASPLEETLPPGRGQFYYHQKLYQRYMRVYDRLLIMDATGTGKTCSVLGFPERVRKERLKPIGSADKRLSQYKRSVILVKNEHLINEFKKQLVCRCSDGHYETAHVQASRTEDTRKRRITEEIKRAGYELYTYSTFASYIIKEYGDGSDYYGNRRLIADYHHSIFWVDEAHYILDESSKEVSTDDVNKMLSVDVIYSQLMRVFHTVPQTKIFLTTATPMTNSTSSLGYLMNLIIPKSLPKDYDLGLTTENDLRVLFSSYRGSLSQFKMLPRSEAAKYYDAQFPQDFAYDTATIDDIEPRVRGRIAYIRGMMGEARVVDMGTEYTYQLNENVDGVNTTSNVVQRLFVSQMSQFQSEAYSRAIESDSRFSFLPNQRQASMFVYPDGYWRSPKGEKVGYNKYIKTHSSSTVISTATRGHKMVQVKEVKVGEFYPTPEFKKEMQVLDSEGVIDVNATLDRIERCGCKYANAIRLMLQPDNVGNCFVYEEFYTGPGTICFATCLMLLGFEQFKGEESAYQSISTSSSEGAAVASYCVDPLATSVRRIIIDKRPRFILLSSEATPAQFNNMIELMNDSANMHGEYVKIFITSRVGREGLSVFNVTQRHILGPEWNISNVDQAGARALRVGGHSDLIRWLRQKYIDEGKDPSSATIVLESYLHAAVPSNGDPNDSSDLYMYRYADAKQRPIARLMLMLIRCSVTCQINKTRNVRGDDVDYSKSCFYDKCDYSCYDYQDQEGNVTMGSDYSTYDLVYAQPRINQVKDQVINVLNQIPALSLSELVSKIHPPNAEHGVVNEITKLVLSALEQLIQSKTIVTNRLGYPCYVREDSDRFYLDYSYPDGPAEYDMKRYVESIVLTEPSSLSLIINKSKNQGDVMAGVDLSSIDSVREYFETIVGNSETEWMQRIAAVEHMVKQKEKGMSVPALDVILNCGFIPIFYLPYPEEKFNEIERKGASTHKKGRPQKDPTKYTLTNKPLTDEELATYPKTAPPDKMIYVHTMKSLINPGTTDYNVVSSYLRGGRTDAQKKILDGEVRIYWPTTGEWSNASLTAEKVLIPWIQKAIQVRISQNFSDYYDLEIGGELRISRVNDEVVNKVKRIRGALSSNKPPNEIMEVSYALYLSEEGREVFRERLPLEIDEKAVQRDWTIRLSDPIVQKMWASSRGPGLEIFSGPDGLPLANLSKMEYYLSVARDVEENADETKVDDYLREMLRAQFHRLGLVASTDILDCLRSPVASKVETLYKQGKKNVVISPSVFDFTIRKEPRIVERVTEGRIPIQSSRQSLHSPELQLPRLSVPIQGISAISGGGLALPLSHDSGSSAGLPSPPINVPRLSGSGIGRIPPQ
jgi:hypothetical protein